jgi:membrane dipeptidase
MLIFDAHLDLAMNALEWNRDLRGRWRKSVREAARTDKSTAERNRVVPRDAPAGRLVRRDPDARYAKPGNPLSGWHTPSRPGPRRKVAARYRAMKRPAMTPITSLLH